MIRHQKASIAWLEFELLLEAGLKHAVFLRQGGYSESNFQGLNLSTCVGDCPNKVLLNRLEVQKTFMIPSWQECHQVHGTKLIEASLQYQGIPQEGDGIMTSSPNLPLAAFHADCQVAIFFAPTKKSIALIHAGWKGLAKGFYKKAIFKFCHLYRLKPCDLLVAIGPSLGPDSAQMKNYKTELPELLWRYQIKPYYFDFWQIGKDQVLEAGVRESHFEIACMDTYASPHDYFSYRYNRITGRHATVAII